MAEQAPMVEVCIFQIRQFLTQVEQMKAMQVEDAALSPEDVNTIGLAMENIKKSAVIMRFSELANLAESLGAIALYLRQRRPENVSYAPLKNFVRQVGLFFRQALNKLDWNSVPDASSVSLCAWGENLLYQIKLANGDAEQEDLTTGIAEVPVEKRIYIGPAKQKETTLVHVYAVTVFFLHADGVEDIQAYSFLQYLQDRVREMHHLPAKILEDDCSVDTIRSIGLRIWLTSELKEAEMCEFLRNTRSVERFELTELDSVAQCEYWPSAEAEALTAADYGPCVHACNQEQENGYVAGIINQSFYDMPMSPGVAVQFLKVRELVNDLVLADAFAAQNAYPQAQLQVRRLIAQLERRVRTLVPMALSGDAQVPDSLWIEGTSASVGSLRFTFPNAFIRQPFKPEPMDIFTDEDGKILFMRDGECMQLIQLGKLYGMKNAVEDPTEGIILIVDGGGQPYGVLVDRLLDVQELEVKPVPDFVKDMMCCEDCDCIVGCTFLQDGSISMVLDVADLAEHL